MKAWQVPQALLYYEKVFPDVYPEIFLAAIIAL